MADGLKPTPDGFDAMEDSLTRSRAIIESLRAEIAKYRGMEVEIAALKNGLEALRGAFLGHLCRELGDSTVEVTMAAEDYVTISRIAGGK